MRFCLFGCVVTLAGLTARKAAHRRETIRRTVATGATVRRLLLAGRWPDVGHAARLPTFRGCRTADVGRTFAPCCRTARRTAGRTTGRTGAQRTGGTGNVPTDRPERATGHGRHVWPDVGHAARYCRPSEVAGRRDTPQGEQHGARERGAPRDGQRAGRNAGTRHGARTARPARCRARTAANGCAPSRVSRTFALA